MRRMPWLRVVSGIVLEAWWHAWDLAIAELAEAVGQGRA